MNPAFLLAAQQVVDYAQRQRQAREERRQAAAKMLADQAADFGASTAPVQAAAAERDASMLTQPDNLAMVQSFLKSQQQPPPGKPGQPTQDDMSWLEPQYRRQRY